jgi:hypothetical protein
MATVNINGHVHKVLLLTQASFVLNRVACGANYQQCRMLHLLLLFVSNDIIKTNKQANKQANKQTNEQVSKQTSKQIIQPL